MPEYKKQPFKEIFTGANEQGTVIVKMMLQTENACRLRIAVSFRHLQVAPLHRIPTSDRNPFSILLAIDLLDQMLRLDADTRITAEAALDHPYLEIYADHDDEVGG